MVPGSRKETLATLRSTVQTHGPFDAILILMGIGVYEPFDEEFLQPLTPHLKIMGSASAGFNEFDVDWMTKNNIVFCNSRNAVNEATADMALLMMLGILRDIQGRAASIAKGTWRGLENGRLMPTRDPSGLKLGIVGMGAIGKVSEPAQTFKLLLTDDKACCSESQSFQHGAVVLQTHTAFHSRRSRAWLVLSPEPSRSPKRIRCHYSALPSQRRHKGLAFLQGI